MGSCRDLQGFAYEKITVADTAIGGTPATYAPSTGPRARAALITVESNTIRFKYNGGAATSTDGHVMQAGDSVRIEGASSVANLSMIRTTANSATVHVTYER